MTREQIVTVLQRYREAFSIEDSKPARSPQDMTISLTDDLDLFFDHLWWMVEEMLKEPCEMSTEKQMRWIGFIQGALWASGVQTIDELKEDNR